MLSDVYDRPSGEYREPIGGSFHSHRLPTALLLTAHTLLSRRRSEPDVANFCGLERVNKTVSARRVCSSPIFASDFSRPNAD
jgi:hypothetical protein